jgi:3-deoxy-manno-octulosonate cytidylyltransferase (CMP-KDO synthetase)
MGSKRLPGKPLAMIGKYSLILHCVMRAQEAYIEPYVATNSEEVAKSLVGWMDNEAIITGECASGTDRVAAAAEIIDPDGKHEHIINYQGDMPFLNPDNLKAFVDYTEAANVDVTTAVCELQIVEVHHGFARKTHLSHIGLYGYKRDALRKFAATPQSESERYYGLEQLRCPDKFKYGYMYFASMPIEINTGNDLEEANRLCKLLR